MVVDLDRFKEVNDTLGQVAGDEVLQQVGRRLQPHLRPDRSWPGSAATSSPPR
jgi:diguanylate cyclase (GGDEF)-like protein